MKKYLYIISAFLCVFVIDAMAGRYAEHSVLKDGEWHKIEITESGIHKITYEQLVSMGIKNPADVRIYGYGGAQLEELFTNPYIDDLPEVSIHMEKGEDGVFGKGDYLLFYAQGPISWKYNTKKEQFEHTVNAYSNHGYYFVTSTLGAGKKISDRATIESNTTKIIDTFNDYYLHEIDKINLQNSGRVYLGEEFNQTYPSRTFSVTLHDVIRNSASININVAHIAVTDASVKVEIDGKNVGESKLAARPSNYITAVAANDVYDFTPLKDNGFNVKLIYTYPLSKAYLDYFIIKYNRKLRKIQNEVLAFRNVEYLGRSLKYTYALDNADENVKIWDITNRQQVRAVPTQKDGNRLTFVDDVATLHEYIAVDVKNDNFKEVKYVGRVKNQDLHSVGQVDMVIISPEEFIADANRLAQAHTEYDGIDVCVVTPEALYNEFSSGTPDATSYRRFMKMFYDRSKEVGNAPKYLLLFGDGSFDNRQLLKSNTDVDIYRLLTFQAQESFSETASFVTDDYFGFLDDTEGKRLVIELMDIAVGRIPVYNKEQSAGVVDKLIRYIKNDDFGSWKNSAVFLADDGDENEHIFGVDSVCDFMQRLNPNLLTRKLYLDSYIQEVSAVGESYPMLKKEFDDYINNGMLFINYMGHSNYMGWTNEQILTGEDIENMHNQRLPLYITASCSFSRFDDFKVSGGELLMTNGNGGAVGLISTSRTVYAQPNLLLNIEIAKELLNHNPQTDRMNTIGEAYMKAKNKRAKSSDSNRLCFVYLGDPAVRLNYPHDHVINVDSINNTDISASTDTVGALGLVNIKGSIRFREDSIIDNTFNGFVHVTIFDKDEKIETLCNDADGSRNSTPFVYTYRTNPIYSGQVSVENGEFKLQFLLPKDIRYNFGAGRIVMYAADKEQGLEANGNCERMIIGGEDENAVLEEEGPEVKIYLNTPTFVNGNKVDENPLFVAEVNDQSGINTIGSGIGHDIIIKLDNDPQQEYVLNAYYETLFGKYNQGVVNYPLKNLAPGKHMLYFRVWDLQNNSSSAEIEFEVVPGLKIDVNEMYVYPNPVKEVANIVVKHDKPAQQTELQVYVYDMSGRMIWKGKEKLVTDKTSTTTFKWSIDNSVNDGLYFVKAVMYDSNKQKDYKTTKILVRRQ